jgi:PAS domain S-box-containing protein
MSSISTPPSVDQVRKEQSLRTISASHLVLVLILLALASLVLIYRFSGVELAREVNNWQVRLNLIADSRVREVNGWISGQFGELQALADNASLQLYVTSLESGETEPAGETPAERSYLRNLLLFTAQKAAYGTDQNSPVNQIPANIRRAGVGGIAVIDNTGKTLVATPEMPAIEGALLQKLQAQEFGKSALLDVERNPSGMLTIGFVVPVFSIQGERDANSQIARVVGIRLVNDELFSKLTHPGVTEKTLEALLVKQDGENVVNVSPLKDGTKPLEKPIKATTPNVDVIYAISNPGSFSESKDISGREVLMTSRTISGAPWVLVTRIDRKEALRDGNSWRARMTTILALMLALVIAVIAASWWYGTSKRATQLSIHSNKLAAQYAQQDKLLRLVTDNQPEPIFITDRFSKVWFVNDKAAHVFKSPASELIGKELSHVMGPSAAQEYMEANKSALELDKNVSRISRQYEEGEQRIIRSEHIPLSHIPIESLTYPTAGVLVIDQDITEAVSEREKRSNTLKQIVDTLVKMVDQRDPYAANHSSMVAMIAREMAEEMGLDTRTVETTETAGNLMNIGKIVVPSEVLTKSAALNENELVVIRKSLKQSADVLRGIVFDGPVVETLEQAQEHWDGTGPGKRKGDDILVSARIISVANAFVGMVSPRSYRAALGVDQVLKILLEQINTRFDRRAVIALVNYIENKGGRKELAKLEIGKVA